MMKTFKRRTQIDIETHEIITVRLNGEHKRIVCEDCGREIEPRSLIKGDENNETTIHTSIRNSDDDGHELCTGQQE
ncbi:MAG: hypothetical protein WBD22_06010 [Pyrinomonadaceae bacterium]